MRILKFEILFITVIFLPLYSPSSMATVLCPQQYIENFERTEISDNFKNFIREIILYYQMTLSDSYPKGIKGGEVNFHYDLIQHINSRYWSEAICSGKSSNFYDLMGTSIIKGLPGFVDIGFSYFKNRNFGDNLFKGFVSWAIVPGWEDQYSFSVKAEASYVDSRVWYFIYGFTLSAILSKRIGRFTPYVGVIVTFDKVFNYSKYDDYFPNPFIYTGKGTIGVNYSLWLIKAGFQVSISNLLNYMFNLSVNF